MLTETLLFLLLLLVGYSIIPSKPQRLPPGLWGWPLIGAFPKQGTSIVHEVQRLQKEFGDIISWRMGSRIIIFLCNYKIIKSVFSELEASDKPKFYSFQSTTLFTGGGIINSNGAHWQNNRRFVIRHLKDLGFGKTILENAIQEEAVALIDSFKKQLGSPKGLPWSINVAVINVLWQLVAGRRYETDDPSIIKLNKTVDEIMHGFEGPVQWLDYFPWLLPVMPESLKKSAGMKTILEKTSILTDSFKNVIEEHREKLDTENPKDLIDAYLIEMNSDKNETNSHMSILDLQIILSDLFITGSDTTSNTIRWALIYMAKYPDVQRKIQQEIDSVVPRSTLPSVHDKERLPYTEAVMYEVNRIVTLAALGAPHYASEDIHTNGYTIPKGSVLFAHLLSCHFDPVYWDTPEDFRPENFLDNQGKVIRNKEGYIPFSLGRRSCVGEPLAKMEFFIFMTTLLQKFTFMAPEGQDISTEREPNEMLLNFAKDIPLIINERK